VNIYWTIAVIAISIFIGWHGHTWYDGYKDDKKAIIAEQHAAKGESNIITFNQKLNKVIVHDKVNKCINAPVPADMLRLLK
jgi:hypothetical protein